MGCCSCRSGASLLYTLAWVALPWLPPHQYAGEPRESRGDRLWRGLVLAAVCSFGVAVLLSQSWNVLNPCDQRYLGLQVGWCS